MDAPSQKHVFVSYVREDDKVVRRIVAELTKANVHVWIDREQIRPGQKWREAIHCAIQAGAFFLACFSSNSAARDRSYMNEEILLAIDELRKRAIGRQWFIPVRLSDVEIPRYPIGPAETLQDIQWIDVFDDWRAALTAIISVIAPSYVPPKRTNKILIGMWASVAVASVLASRYLAHRPVTIPAPIAHHVVKIEGASEDGKYSLTPLLRSQYGALWNSLIVNPDASDRATHAVEEIATHRSRYQQVSAVTGVPWQVIAAIHLEQANLNFDTHLHNGDPLSSRTVHMPAGRPPTGSPPFTWETSAIDCVRLYGLSKNRDWTVAATLYAIESVNGFGYRRYGVATPYLWAGSTHYKRGKFMTDGIFDPEAKAATIGAALILRKLNYGGGAT